MTIYLNTQTKEYPRHNGDLELLGWKVGQALPENWVEVEYQEPPMVDEDTWCGETLPTLVDGVWKVTWITRPLTTSEKALKNTPYPTDGNYYRWGESTLSWVEIGA